MTRPVTLVIPAAGAGLRLDPKQPKQFLTHRGLSLLEWTLKAFEPIMPRLSHVVVALPEAYLTQINLQHTLPSLSLICGGATRQQSVHLGLRHLDHLDLLNNSHCLIHDAARPLLHREDLLKLLAALDENPLPALLATPAKDTLKQSNSYGIIEHTLPRQHLWHAQTPQAALGEVMFNAHQQAETLGWEVTDDASILEQAGHTVRLIESDHSNFKVTQAQDWELFKRLI